ncbi:hypothetical protein [Pantoea phage Nafs113]|nr:hypothetical protein [Pantoea phage Nafs113]
MIYPKGVFVNDPKIVNRLITIYMVTGQHISEHLHLFIV